MSEKNLPALDEEFFAVITSAIKAASWKYEDFPRVQKTEGQIAALFDFYEDKFINTAEVPTDNPIASPSPIGLPNNPILEPTTPDQNIVTPDQAKKAPVRSMPDDIKDLVETGIEIAKNPPRVKEVQVLETPTDPDAARQSWNKPF